MWRMSYETVSRNAEAYVRKCFSEAVAQRFSLKKLLLEILQIYKKKLCQNLFLIKLQASASACNFNQKESLVQVFFCEFCEISRNTFSYRTTLVADKFSDIHKKICLEVPL